MSLSSSSSSSSSMISSILSSWNSPPLIGALTLGCYGVLPFLLLGGGGSSSNRSASSPSWIVPTSPTTIVSWNMIRVSNALAYGLSLWSVSQPGRYDGQAAAIDEKTKDDDDAADLDDNDAAAKKGMQRLSAGRKGRTLVAPAGWAFAIWGPIFIGEFIMVTTQLFMASNNEQDEATMAPIIRQITGPYILAQCFQALWTASFRPKYNPNEPSTTTTEGSKISFKRYHKYISALNLSGIALSLSLCHASFATTDHSSLSGEGGRPIILSTKDYWIHCLPLTLHFGWTTAAALVNWNGMYALSPNVSAKSVAWLGHGSVVVATILGMGITLVRQAPVYGGVIAWALAAVASGMTKRLQETKDSDQNAVGVYGAKLQYQLSTVGAALCAATSLWVTSSLGRQRK